MSTDLFGEDRVLLARVDDTDYLAVRMVYACRGDDPPSLYCPESEWAASPMARIASLQARVAELESALEARTETPVQNQERMFQTQATIGSRDANPGPCPDCGKTDLKNARALQMHRQRAHQGMVAIKSSPAQFVEPLGWRCAAKGCTGAHARDLHDPDFCTLHADRNTNGSAVQR